MTNNISINTTVYPMCESEGLATYTADFENEKLTDQVITVHIAAVGHNYGDWIAEDFYCEEAGTVGHYHCDACGKDFDIDKNKLEKVERFHDTYHNEAVVAKVGVVSRPWADRLLVGITYSQMYKDIQTGVRQEIVYGEKHRKGHTLMPSLEYAKRDLLLKGLDAAMTLNYNRNMTENVDTASYKYNWLAETKLLNSPGEQSYQHSRSYNDNWSATATLNYRLGEFHHFTFNHVFNAFSRSNESL
jgi:hypothetical protein